MRKSITYRRAGFVLAVLGLVTGCVPSLHPIYTNADLIFEPALLGTWSDDDETWSFSAHDPNSYRLIVKDDEGVEGSFVVHLAEIDGKRFLDLFPTELDDGVNGFYTAHFVRAHTFFFVEQIDPQLRMSGIDPDWLSEHIEANPGAIRHESLDGEILLTASTGELQEFLLRHLTTPGAFGEPSNMIRN